MNAAGDTVAAFLEFVRTLPAQGRPAVVGLCGPQGSGKSTLAATVLDRLEAEGRTVALLSLDDLYLTRDARRVLAEQVHPLFATRGVPGTHDVALGLDVLAALRAGRPVALPRFDKGTDDRCPRDRWPVAPAPVDLVLFEGWCVGARPEPQAALAAPVNALERDEDAAAIWRGHANAALAGPYQTLFGTLDGLCLLTPPDFDTVIGWRQEQERALRARSEVPGRAMSDAAVERFVRHYERLTRHILAEMPPRADLVVALDATRRAVSIRR